VDKFSDFISEQVTEKPYKLLILVAQTQDDQNKTGVILEKEAKKLGIEVYQFEVNDGYIRTNEKGNLVFHNYIYEKGTGGIPKREEHDKKGFEVTPEDTVCLPRSSNGKVIRLSDTLRLNNVFVINPKFAMTMCNDKWLNHVAMKVAGLRQPKTSYVKTSKNIDVSLNDIGNKFPIILKTMDGAAGIGVSFIESKKNLVSTLQMMDKLKPKRSVIIQEYIKVDYDVRVFVLNNEIVAQIKRPIPEDDFRGNISQGNVAKKIELTELEKTECIKATKSVKGMMVGVDFLPSKNREKEKPYFLEVNVSPGTSYINELNDINIHKIILNTFKNRDNWRET